MKTKTKIALVFSLEYLDEFDNIIDKYKTENADIIEFRADFLKEKNFHDFTKIVKNIKLKTNKEIIFTLRSKEQGGNFSGTREEYYKILSKISENEFIDFIDIEYIADNVSVKKCILECKENSKKVILSHHDFNKTDNVDKIRNIILDMKSMGADICKIAYWANNYNDFANMLEVSNFFKNYDENIKMILISMGKIGRISRYLTNEFNSSISYATLEENNEIGQINVNKLKKILKILDEIN